MRTIYLITFYNLGISVVRYYWLCEQMSGIYVEESVGIVLRRSFRTPADWRSLRLLPATTGVAHGYVLIYRSLGLPATIRGFLRTMTDGFSRATRFSLHTFRVAEIHSLALYFLFYILLQI